MEKEIFVGIVIGAISYGTLIHRPMHVHFSCSTRLLGIVVVLFFRCLGVLLGPVNPTVQKGISWTLAAHALATFSLFTISMVVTLNNLSVIYINDREFLGNDEYPPGPTGYYLVLVADAIDIVVAAAFPLNQWLADGLLVRSILNSVAWVFNVGRPCSCVVVISFVL